MQVQQEGFLVHDQAWVAPAVAWLAPASQHAAAEASQPDQHFAGCQELAFALVHLSLDHLQELHSTSNLPTQDWAGVNKMLLADCHGSAGGLPSAQAQ